MTTNRVAFPPWSQEAMATVACCRITLAETKGRGWWVVEGCLPRETPDRGLPITTRAGEIVSRSDNAQMLFVEL